MAKLTIDVLKNALPPAGLRLELRDDQTPGLIFRVTPTGHRSWSYRYRSSAGEQRRQTLGDFPAVGLAEARRRASMARGEVSGGADPVQTQRDERKAATTKRLQVLSGLTDAYFADAADGLHRPDADPKRPATLAEEKRVYEKHVKPRFGTWSIADITRRRPDVRQRTDQEGQVARSGVSEHHSSAPQLC